MDGGVQEKKGTLLVFFASEAKLKVLSSHAAGPGRPVLLVHSGLPRGGVGQDGHRRWKRIVG